MGRCDGTRRTDGVDVSEAAKMEGSPPACHPVMPKADEYARCGLGDMRLRREAA